MSARRITDAGTRIEPPSRARRLACLVVLRAPVTVAAAVGLGMATATPLGMFGLWRPVIVLPVLLVTTALAVRVGRSVPVRALPWPAALLLVAVAVGSGVWAGATHGEQVVLRRDAGSYALYAQHLASTGHITVDPRVSALGGTTVLNDPSVRIDSAAFYRVGQTIVPQFLPGAPAAFTLGWWAGGWTGLLLVPAVLGALALAAIASLAVRLVGPWWAVLATAGVAVLQPVIHVFRATYSEPAALVLLAAGLAVLTDATAGPGRRGAGGPRQDSPAAVQATRRLGLLAGLLIGAASLVRIDGLREVVVLVPLVALLIVRRHPAGRRLAWGVIVATVYAMAAAWLASRPYLESIGGSLWPLGVLAAAVLLACLAVASLGRWVSARRGTVAAARRAAARWLPTAGAVLVGVVLIYLASRPLWQVIRQSPNDPGSKVVAGLQLMQHLRVDGGRTYAEQSVTWVVWYAGLAAVLLAGIASVVLVQRTLVALRDQEGVPAWTGPLLLALASGVLTLYRPGITPDHPWADRRLVPVVLPAVTLLAVAALVAGARALGRPWRPAVAVVGVLGAVAVLAPAWQATAPLAGQSTERGELAAVTYLCRSLRGGDVTIMVDRRAQLEWPQVVRGVCGVPAASIAVRAKAGTPASTHELLAALSRVAPQVRKAGGRPVLLATDPTSLTRLGLPAVRIVNLLTTEDQRLLEARPKGSAALSVQLFAATWPAGASG